MPVALRALLLLAAAVAGAAAGLLGSFVHPLTVVLLPVGLLLAFALSAAVFVTAGLLLGRAGAVAAGAGWVVTVLVLASPRPEGDLVVAGIDRRVRLAVRRHPARRRVPGAALRTAAPARRTAFSDPRRRPMNRTWAPTRR